MLPTLIKFLFGKVIGLDKIPPEHKKKAAQVAVSTIQNMELSFDPQTKAINVKFKKEF